MKRVYRFRAWSEYGKDMRFGHRVFDMNSGAIERMFVFPGEEGLHIMQYTGLKDEGGQHIYEGDLVRHVVDCGPGGLQIVISEVEITPFGTCLQPWTFELPGYLPKVLGNKFENPEIVVGKVG